MATDWKIQAACRGTAEAELFYSDDPADRQYVIHQYCDHCPVRDTCLDAADRYGVWGGTTPHQRSRNPPPRRKAVA